MSIKHSFWRKATALMASLAFLLTSAFSWSAMTASADVAAPVITTAPFTSSTTPVTVSGTADASSTINITGGASTSMATTSASGSWSALVNLILNSINHLAVTATSNGSTSATSTIDVTYDTIAPVFATTSDVTATSTSVNGASVNFITPVATDNFTASSTVTCSPASGSTFRAGTTTVTCTTSDNAGNTASTSFMVLVSPFIAPPMPGGHEHPTGGGGAGGGGNSTSTATTTLFVPPGLFIASQVANPNSAVGTVLARFIAAGNPPSSSFVFTRILKFGMRGGDVLQLQAYLKSKGYLKGTLTGFFGKTTRVAVKAYQRAHGLPPTGNVGVRTMALLNSTFSLAVR